jgi:hypothetical protein
MGGGVGVDADGNFFLQRLLCSTSAPERFLGKPTYWHETLNLNPERHAMLRSSFVLFFAGGGHTTGA